MENQNQSSVLLVTFPGQGNINPSLEFAKRLVKTGIKVTFLTGDNAISRMVSTNPCDQGLTFLGFSDGFEEGLKLGKTFDEMMDVQKKRGSEALKDIILSSIENAQPFSRVFYSLLFQWVGHVARALEVPSTLFWIQPGALLNIYYYYFNGYGEAIRNHGNDYSWSVELPGLPPLTIRDLPSFIVDLNSFKFVVSSIKEHFDILKEENNPKVLVNSFHELENVALMGVTNLNLVPIGPLVPSAFLDGKDPSDNSFGGDLLKKSDGYIEWLDLKEKGSVIYVSFGSYSQLPKRQMEEIAKGLIDSERPFLWVIRKNKDDKESYMDVFKEGLEKQGKIVEWCSQVEVLSHSSIGCFVSHCGWNSSLESITCGVPLVCFPLWNDQTTNAKLIEDVWEFGVRVKKIEEIVKESEIKKRSEIVMGYKEIVKGSEIKKCIDIVMGDGEKGEKMRNNAEKWKNLARETAKEDGSSYMNLKNFVEEEILNVLQH